MESAVDFFRRNRQITGAYADSVCHRIGDRWRDRRERALTDALDLVGTDTVGGWRPASISSSPRAVGSARRAANSAWESPRCIR